MQSLETLAGVDASAKTLAACRWCDGRTEDREFSNDDKGHRELRKWLGKKARICVEATGVYHLQLAMFLHAAGVKVMVVNPRVAKDFARSLSNRSKTDKVDARALLEYVRRMEFRPWQPPTAAILELREIGRRITELTNEMIAEKNRLHAKQTARLSRVVINDVRSHIEQIERRIKLLEKAAMTTISGEADLSEQYRVLLSARGIGKRSAILLLSELAVLDPTMDVRQLVAYSGLDPRRYESGTSVLRPTRISKVGNARVRAILYMVALSGIRHDRGARAFYAGLVSRGKHRMVALVAVMRKYLHGVWIAMQRRVAFDNAILFAASLAQAESSDSAVAALQPQPGQDHPEGRSEAEELRQQLDPGRAEATPARRRRSKAA
jgi:transposase